MRTTYFWKATHEPEAGAKYVSISRQNLRGAETMETYPALMPGWDIINMAHNLGYSEECLKKYREEYFKQLDGLDVRKVYEDLKDCVLVCFEAPKDLVTGKKFCHRRMVAGWIESEFGIVVPEEVREKDRGLVVPAIYRN